MSAPADAYKQALEGHAYTQILEVANEDVGQVIGKKGATIQLVERETGAHIQVPLPPPPLALALPPLPLPCLLGAIGEEAAGEKGSAPAPLEGKRAGASSAAAQACDACHESTCSM